MSQIFASTPPRSQRRPRRALTAVVAVAAAGVLAAAAYAGYALTRPATQLESIGCYQADSLDANTAVLASGTDSPVAACAAKWASAFPTVQRPTNFAACVLGNGSIGVFPADASTDTCRNLGLAHLAQTPATQQQAQEFIELKRDLNTVFEGSTCLSRDEALARTKVVLASNSLSTGRSRPVPASTERALAASAPAPASPTTPQTRPSFCPRSNTVTAGTREKWGASGGCPHRVPVR